MPYSSVARYQRLTSYSAWLAHSLCIASYTFHWSILQTEGLGPAASSCTYCACTCSVSSPDPAPKRDKGSGVRFLLMRTWYMWGNFCSSSMSHRSTAASSSQAREQQQQQQENRQVSPHVYNSRWSSKINGLGYVYQPPRLLNPQIVCWTWVNIWSNDSENLNCSLFICI